MILFDAKPPRGRGVARRPRPAASTGGCSRASRSPSPGLLAGGLHAGNLAAAVALTKAPIVDVSSGVESRPGVKDPAQLEAFFAAARLALDEDLSR